MGISVRAGAVNSVHKNGDIGPSLHHKNDEFRRLLRETGLNQSELAERIDTHANTISGWFTNKAKPPGAVLAYLRLLARVQALDG